MMNKLSLTFVAALALAAGGCKKKGGADCDKAIDHSMELAKADMQKMGNDDAAIAKMKSIGVQHCKDDKWSDDAVKCMNDAKTEADAQACYGKLTQDQRDKMNKAAMALMTPPANPTPAGSDMAGSAVGSAAPAAGSDMGSAGSAMAGSAAGSAK